VKLSARFRKSRLAKIWEEHTPSGAHRARRLAFPAWVPADVRKEAAGLSVAAAEELLSPWPSLAAPKRPKRARTRARVGNGIR
jgi:hypothetical protein